MNEVSIIINGVRYDAVEDADYKNCVFYDKKTKCRGCLLDVRKCVNLIGVDRVFKKSDKKFEI